MILRSGINIFRGSVSSVTFIENILIVV